MSQSPDTIKYRGAFYLKALMLKRQPEFVPSPAGAAPPGGPPGEPPDQYQEIKRCILEEVPGEDGDCNQLAVMQDIVEKAAIALDNFRSLLKTDNPDFLPTVNMLNERMPHAHEQLEKLIFLSQMAHKALKDLRRR